MLREVMRMMIPQRLLPVLHESSFTAWKTLPAAQGADPDGQENLLITGYRTQADLLSIPCEAVMQRAMKEKLSLLLEGVHVTPFLLEKIPRDDSVIFVQIMLAVLKQKELKKRIKGRLQAIPGRDSAQSPASFEDIWRLQECLLDEADQQGVPIVANTDKEEALRDIMKIVMNKIYNKFASTPGEVFGNRHTTNSSIKKNRH
jgi:2-phosphoglycerate kinase